MLNNLFKKFKVAIIVLTGLIFCLILLLPAANYFVIQKFFVPKLNETAVAQEKYYDAIMADLNLLEKSPVFPPVTYKNNAETFLTEHVSWTGKGFTPLETVSHQSLRIFIKSKINLEDKKEITLRSQDPLLEQIDTSWMKDLSQFDHWNFSSNPIVQSKIDTATQKNGISRIGTFSSLPIPDFLELRNFALVHFLQEYKNGRPQEGLKTLRQVAYLMHSAGMLVSQMSAVAVIGMERRMAKALNIKSDLSEMEKQIAAYKRLSWAWVGILQSPWYGKWNSHFDAYLKSENGICAGAYEQITALEGLKEFLEPRFLFEGSFAENYERQRPFQKHIMEICQIKNYSAFFTESPEESRKFFAKIPVISSEDSEPTAEKVSLNYGRIPYLRRLVGLTILTISSPNWFKQYDSASN